MLSQIFMIFFIQILSVNKALWIDSVDVQRLLNNCIICFWDFITFDQFSWVKQNVHVIIWYIVTCATLLFYMIFVWTWQNLSLPIDHVECFLLNLLLMKLLLLFVFCLFQFLVLFLLLQFLLCCGAFLVLVCARSKYKLCLSNKFCHTSDSLCLLPYNNDA